MKKPPTQRTVYSAADSGNLARLEACISAGLDLGAPDREGLTPLFLASRSGKLDAVRLILERVGAGAAVADVRDHPERDPLTGVVGSLAVPPGDKLPILELLVEAGFDVNGEGRDRKTPLAAACDWPHAESTHPVVFRLLELGADAGAVLPDLEARWIDERRYGQLSEREAAAFEALLERLRSHAGASGPVLRPADRLCDAVERYHEDDVAALITGGVEPEALGAALIRAVQLDDPLLVEEADALVRQLLEAGADPNVTDEGDPALALAAHRGRTGAIQALVAAGARPDAADEHGRTALVMAAMGGHAAAVTSLLEAGADPRSESALGTALDVARREGREDVVAALVSGGATERDWGAERGVQSFDAEETIALVRAAPEDVARALARRTPGLRARRVSREQPVELGLRASIVYRFRGSEWSIVDVLIGSPDVGDDGIAADLSRLLGGLALEYSNSGTSDECVLVEYEDGRATARLARTGPHRVKGDWRRVIHRKLADRGAFAPGIRLRHRTGDSIGELGFVAPEAVEVWVLTA